MKCSTSINMSRVNRIVDSIVDFVERAGKPVTLAQIADQVPHFSTDSSGMSWFWEIGDAVLWDGMTREGCRALRKVVGDRRVALAPASLLTYALHGAALPADERWVPIALAPAAMATFRTPVLLWLAPEDMMQEIEKRAAAERLHGFFRVGQAA